MIRKDIYQILFTLGSLLGVSSCASYKNHYSKEAKQWEQNSYYPRVAPNHVMYLVGDAGDATPGKNLPVLQYLKNKLANETENSSVIFLGDNIYEYGMPPKEDTLTRALAEYRILAQLNILDQYKGRPIFIPGNHDWRGWGQSGLKRQEKFVETYLNTHRGISEKDDWENYFLPDDGCSGPTVVELNDDVVVIVVDSNWWLADLDEEPLINNGCEARNKESFKFVFENVVRKYKNKNVVIALHHPPYTYGPHGGGFTVKQHLFPLTDIQSNLYLPLPIIGSVAAAFRSSLGSRQDVAHSDYRELRSALMAGAKKNGNFIFASGHEHGLEYIENDGQKFIVSGSGSKNSPVMLGKGSDFGSGATGYSKLLFYERGETWVQFWAVDVRGDNASLIYSKRIKEAQPPDSEITLEKFLEYEKHELTTIQPVTKNKIEPIGGFHKFLFGEHHRKLYAEKYTFPILDFKTFHGGVNPIKRGGGNQTNSLRVSDNKESDFVMREMTKDATRFLPYPFNKMVAAKYLVEDNFLATHPFAPTAIPVLANAINVYHTNPGLYYIPPQPALGNFNENFGGDMHIVEERPAGSHWDKADFFGNPNTIVGTPDLVEAMLESPIHQVDEAWAVRTRLLDFLIGDWDRHDDQWRWAVINQADGTKLYRPIPRDRDQAFSRYDGLIPGIARQTLPFLRQLQSFGPEIQSMKWTTWSARLFDRTFLNELSWAQWKEQVRFIQLNLTDSVIDNAFNSWPEKAQQLSAEQTKNGLRARRNNLLKIARTHYEFLSQSVDVIGTDEEELFEVHRLNDFHTRVTVSELSKKGKIKRVTYDRTFENEVTKELILYGNGEDDKFLLTGNAKHGIKVRLVGGLGKDVFTDSSKVTSGFRKTIVYDGLQKNTIHPGVETKDKRSDIARYNIYDRRGYDSEYDMIIPIPIAGYNPDDKFLFGANFNIVKHGFKKVPYSSVQNVGASYAFGTQAFKVHYRGDYLSALKEWDLFVDAQYHGPSYSFNFSGIGNESIRTDDDAQYYRVRQERIQLYPALKKRFAGLSGYFTVGPTLDISKIDDTPERFISNYDPTGNIFERKTFVGGLFGLHFENIDNLFSPHSGVRFETNVNWAKPTSENTNFAILHTKIEMYKQLDRKENIILASQIGWNQNFGEGYEFFQMPNLGGDQLRGYRTNRFYGNTSFWQNIDVRVRLSSSENKIVPFSFGIVGSFDYGRVWLKGESFNAWHTSYGGGLWFRPVDTLVLTLGAYVPKEEAEESPRFVFKIGFGF
jgi:hypothetical protein